MKTFLDLIRDLWPIVVIAIGLIATLILTKEKKKKK